MDQFGQVLCMGYADIHRSSGFWYGFAVGRFSGRLTGTCHWTFMALALLPQMVWSLLLRMSMMAAKKPVQMPKSQSLAEVFPTPIKNMRG